MNKIVSVSVTIILISILGFVFFSNKKTDPQFNSNNEVVSPTTAPATDITASFAIFTNGTFRIFTASMYHNLSSDVYIEASNPNVVNVKKENITWNDFFSTLPFKLTSDCLTTGTKQTFCTGNNGSLLFYINGEKNINALDQEIKNGDKLLVTFGIESEKTIAEQLNRIP